MTKQTKITPNSQATFVFSKKESPRKPNEYGRMVFEACNGEVLFKVNIMLLLEEIEFRNPKTALDVEQYALEVLCFILSLPLRDMYLEQYPEFISCNYPTLKFPSSSIVM